MALVVRKSIWEQSMTEFYANIKQVLLQGDGGNDQREQWQRYLSQLEQEQKKLLRLHLQAYLSEETFLRENAIYQEKIQKLQEKIMSLPSINEDTIENSLSSIIKHCEMILNGDVFMEGFYRRMVEKVVIQNKEHIDVYFSGVPYEIQYRTSVD